MDPVYIHLLINHIPILGSLFALILLAYGLFFNNESIGRAALIANMVITLVTVPAYYSGEEAEDKIEEMSGFSEKYLEEHEEMAEPAFTVMLVTGSLSLLTLLVSFTKYEKFRKIMLSLTFVAGIITFGMMAAVGFYGGKIKHNEISGETFEKASQNVSGQTIEETEGEEEGH